MSVCLLDSSHYFVFTLHELLCTGKRKQRELRICASYTTSWRVKFWWTRTMQSDKCNWNCSRLFPHLGQWIKRTVHTHKVNRNEKKKKTNKRQYYLHATSVVITFVFLSVLLCSTVAAATTSSSSSSPCGWTQQLNVCECMVYAPESRRRCRPSVEIVKHKNEYFDGIFSLMSRSINITQQRLISLTQTTLFHRVIILFDTLGLSSIDRNYHPTIRKFRNWG